MLIDQDDGDVLSFLGVGLEGPLNLRVLCLGIDNKKVALSVGRIRYVLQECEDRCQLVAIFAYQERQRGEDDIPQYQQEEGRSRS